MPTRELSDDDLRRVTRIDAVVPRGVPLTLGLCQELARLAPFGLGNPNVTLLAPACALGDLAAVGEGKHLRFRVRTEAGIDGGSAIGFGMGGQLDRYRRPGLYDVAFRLQENRWNGTVAPQLVVQRVFDTPDRYREVRAWFADEFKKAIRARSAGRGGLRRAQARGRRTPEPARVRTVPRVPRRPAASARRVACFAPAASWQEPCVQRRTGLPMRFWRRRRMRRLNSLAALLIELDQLADGRRANRLRTTVRFSRALLRSLR